MLHRSKEVVRLAYGTNWCAQARRLGEVARALLCIAYQTYWFCNFGLEKWIVLRALQEQVTVRRDQVSKKSL